MPLSTALASDLAAPAPSASRQQIVDVLADFSIETTPAAVARHGGLGLLPAATRVYIAFVPGEDWRDVVAAASEVRAANLTPVPHLPARSIASEGELDAFLRRLTGEAGVDQVLAIGGGLDEPQGPFASSLALLETGLLAAPRHPHDRRCRPSRGRAGAAPARGDHDPRAEGRLRQKRQKAALRLVTQFVFDAEPMLAWERAIRGHGLPIHVGVPGPATLKTLLAYARMCGIGNSMRVLTRQGGNLLRLARLSYPDALITALARHRATEPASRIERLHLYPFGGLARTARWLEAVPAPGRSPCTTTAWASRSIPSKAEPAAPKKTTSLPSSSTPAFSGTGASGVSPQRSTIRPSTSSCRRSVPSSQARTPRRPSASWWVRHGDCQSSAQQIEQDADGHHGEPAEKPAKLHGELVRQFDPKVLNLLGHLHPQPLDLAGDDRVQMVLRGDALLDLIAQMLRERPRKVGVDPILRPDVSPTAPRSSRSPLEGMIHHFS